MIWLAQKNTTRKPEEQEKNWVKEKEKGKPNPERRKRREKEMENIKSKILRR
jgi:hypothetical protein